MKKEKDYLIAEYEERTEVIEDLRRKIDNPPPDRLLREHRKLEARLRSLEDEKICRYRLAKEIIKAGHQLLLVVDKNVGYFCGEYSQAGHPEIHYGVSSCAVATYRGVSFRNISPKEFMERVLAADSQK